MNAEQRIWWELHRDGYKAVYLLSKKNQDFSIETYGDKEAVMPTTGIFGGITQNPNEKRFRVSLKQWMDEGSALVCPLDTFCQVVDSGIRYKETTQLLLGEVLKKHQGVIVLIVTPESKEYLEKSDFLKAYLDQVKDHKRDDVRRWDCFLGPDIANCLEQVILEDPRRLQDYPAIGLMAEYLEMTLSEEDYVIDELFAAGKPRLYRELLDVMKDLDAWIHVKQKSRKITLRRFGNEFTLSPELAEHSYTAEGAPKILADIQEAVRMMDRKRVNYRIKSIASQFVAIMDEEYRNKDWGSYERALYAIRFCLQWIDVPLGSEQEAAIRNILERLKQYIQLSEKWFQEERGLLMFQVKKEHSVAARAKEQAQIRHMATERMLTKLEDLILTTILNLTMHAKEAFSVKKVAHMIMEAADRVQKEVELLEEESLAEFEDEGAAVEEEELLLTDGDLQEGNEGGIEEDPGAEADEEYEYVLTEKDYELKL